MFLVNVCHDQNMDFCTDLASVRPVGMSLMERRGQVRYVAQEAQ